MTKFKHNVGNKAKDRLTNYKGIIVSRTEWITGCNTYGIQATIKEGIIPDPQNVDEDSIKILQGGLSLKSKKIKEPGGPKNSYPKKKIN